jgi:hypothetical protein
VDPFSKFWGMLEECLDVVSRPVAFASVPLGPKSEETRQGEDGHDEEGRKERERLKRERKRSKSKAKGTEIGEYQFCSGRWAGADRARSHCLTERFVLYGLV